MYRLFYFFIISLLLIFHLGCFHLTQKTDHPKIGVIIGAGGARALSAIGVLKTLQSHRIPIDYLVGIGWGAWVAAVYSKNQSIDEVQWSFHKLAKRGIFKSSFLKNPLNAKNVEILNVDLKENFDIKTPTQIPFSCPSLTKKGDKVWQTQKFLERSVRNCLTVPPFFKLNSYVLGSLFSIRDSISFLKKEKMDIIIWIHPIKDGNLFPQYFSNNISYLFWSEMRAVFSKIQEEPHVKQVSPELGSYYLYDFSKINSIISTGEEEGQNLVKILHKRYPKLKL